MLLGNTEIVYETHRELIDGKRDETLNEFIKNTFGLENVFLTKLVVGRCVGHGERASKEEVLLRNEEEAVKFISSRDSMESRSILIHDKYDYSTSTNEAIESKDLKENVVISRGQWNDLVYSLKKLEMSMKDGKVPQESGEVHPNLVCDGRCTTVQSGASKTYGARFQCPLCETGGYESCGHGAAHNFVGVNDPTNTGLLWRPLDKTMQSTTKVISTDKQVVIEISRDRVNLFSMFSNVESLDNIAHGYEMYKEWTKVLGDQMVDEILKNASAKQPAESAHLLLRNNKKRFSKRAGKLKVEMSEEDTDGRDSIWVFKIHNEQDTVVPGGLTFVCDDTSRDYTRLVSFDVPMGSHGILPGNCEVVKFDWSSPAEDHLRISETRGGSRGSNGLVTLVDEQHTMKYRAFARFRPGYSFTLEAVPAEGYQGKLTVDLYRKYNVMFFHLHNGLSFPISKGFHLYCHENEDNHVNGRCEETIDDTLLPGYSMVFEYLIYKKVEEYTTDVRLFTSKPRRGDILILDSAYDIKYKASSILQAGIHVILEPVNPTNVQKMSDLQLIHETDSDEDDSDAAITSPSETSEKSLDSEE